MPVHEVVQVTPAQYVVAWAVIFLMPVSQFTVLQSALVVQHVASSLPVTPFLAGSRILLALQVYVAPLHLVVSSTQQVGTSLPVPEVAHKLVAQYVVA